MNFLRNQKTKTSTKQSTTIKTVALTDLMLSPHCGFHPRQLLSGILGNITNIKNTSTAIITNTATTNAVKPDCLASRAVLFVLNCLINPNIIFLNPPICWAPGFIGILNSSLILNSGFLIRN